MFLHNRSLAAFQMTTVGCYVAHFPRFKNHLDNFVDSFLWLPIGLLDYEIL
jgi:hypothetical protein